MTREQARPLHAAPAPDPEAVTADAFAQAMRERFPLESEVVLLSLVVDQYRRQATDRQEDDR